MFWPSKSDDENGSANKKPKLSEENMTSSEELYIMKVDNSNKILERVQQLFHDHSMSDVTLVVGGKEYPAHRLILCLTSDVFQIMLMRPEWTEWRENRVVLQEPDACVMVFHSFLEYFYSGQITLTHENVMPILALSDKYNVKTLSQMCINYMCTNIAHAATNNQLISWLQYTLACGHNDVAKICQDLVKWNLEKIAYTDDFVNFDSDVLVNLLRQSDLVVRNEMSLYHCTVRWLELQREKFMQEGYIEDEIESQMETLNEQVMLHIRFPMMSPRQLAQLLLCPLTKKYKEFFVERMAIGMIFHSGHEERIQDICASENGKLLFTPRLYTADNFSSILSVDNFYEMPLYSMRSFVFTSHTNLAEYCGDGSCEWVIDMYPKGVWFKKFFLIVWQGKVEVPEFIIPTVRLAITCKSASSDTMLRTKIALLVYGERTGLEHIVHVVEKVHTFTAKDKLLNIDDVIPFDEINKQVIQNKENNISYLTGENKNILKIRIIITPMSDLYSNLEPVFVFK